MPGMTPSCVPDGETALPAPTANPGPAANAAPHTTRVGRYASCARATTVAPTASTLPASKSATTWPPRDSRSEEHTSELQSIMRISYAVLCLKKKNNTQQQNETQH